MFFIASVSAYSMKLIPVERNNVRENINDNIEVPEGCIAVEESHDLAGIIYSDGRVEVLK